MIALGIIGCGGVTRQLHFPALRHARDLKVIAVADLDARALEGFGDARRYRDGQQLIDDPAVQAVAVCTPPASHADLAVRALRAGKHVFVEKPLALSIAEGEAMLEAARTAQKIAMIGFNLRCHRLVRRARDLVASGALGELEQIVTTWVGWSERGQSALFEVGVHHIDACSYLLRDRIVDAQVFDRDKTVSFTARSSGGVLISSSFAPAGAPRNEFRIVGSRGTLSFSAYNATSFTVSHATRPRGGRFYSLGNLPALVRVARAGGDYMLSYREEWKAFAAAVRGEAPPPATFADGFAALELVHQTLSDAR